VEQVKIKHLASAITQTWKKLPGVMRKKRTAVLISGSGKQSSSLSVSDAECATICAVVSTSFQSDKKASEEEVFWGVVAVLQLSPCINGDGTAYNILQIKIIIPLFGQVATVSCH
jgi:hypothetical protein